MNMMAKKICRKCGIEKFQNEYSDTEYNNTNSKCRNCVKIYDQKYYKDNQKEILISRKENYINNKEEKNAYQKIYDTDNKEKISAYQREYRSNNEEKRSAYQKGYTQEHKEELRSKSNTRRNKRAQLDPVFRLHCNVSRSVNKVLKINNGSKSGKSTFEYLPYLPEDLKQHIESKFEPWMSWENYGSYNTKTWNDYDPETWTWQLDHIIPHSEFHYDNLEHPDFQEAWALSNLRPLSSKQNQSDGVKRNRHTNKSKI